MLQLRDSLINGGNINWDTSGNVENDDEENGFDGGVPDFDVHDDEFPGSSNMDEDLPNLEKVSRPCLSQFCTVLTRNNKAQTMRFSVHGFCTAW